MDGWLGELRPYAGEGRASAGWRLMKSAWRLLRGDRTLVLAVFAGAAVMALSFLARLLVDADGAVFQGDRVAVELLIGCLGALAWTFVAFTIAIAADAALDGTPIDTRDAVAEVGELSGPLVGWAAIAVAVWLGASLLVGELDMPWLFSLVQLGWYVLTAFAVAAIAIAGLGPGAALAESATVLRERGRQTLAALFGLLLFTGLALIPACSLLTHAAALRQSGEGGQLPWALAALVVSCVVLAASLACREIFAVMLLRDSLDDLPGREHAGRRLRRRAKIGRVAGGTLAVLVSIAVLGAITRDDTRVLEASRGPGENYSILVENPNRVELETGDCVFYRNVAIGTVIGAEAEGTSLRVRFHLEAGYGPTETPGSFLVTEAGPAGPSLWLIPGLAPEAPNASRS